MEMHNALWHIISQTDMVSKFILILLLAMSIMCWAFSVYKSISIKLKLRQLKQAQFLLKGVATLDEFLIRAARLQDSFVADLIADYVANFKAFLKFYEHTKEPISDTDWYILQTNINQALDATMKKEEALLPVLSTSAQIAPLIGLFGTVWGLIHSFLGIAQQKSADIAAVAPGIAEALITTLAGLIIAIPAIVMFNYTVGRVRMLEQGLIELSDNCVWIMKIISSQKNIPDISNTTPFIVNSLAAKRETI